MSPSLTVLPTPPSLINNRRHLAFQDPLPVQWHPLTSAANEFSCGHAHTEWILLKTDDRSSTGHHDRDFYTCQCDVGRSLPGDSQPNNNNKFVKLISVCGGEFNVLIVHDCYKIAGSFRGQTSITMRPCDCDISAHPGHTTVHILPSVFKPSSAAPSCHSPFQTH